MLEQSAAEYLQLGAHMHLATAMFETLQKQRQARPTENLVLHDKDKEHLGTLLSSIHQICVDLNLPVSTELISSAQKDLPEGRRELDVLFFAVVTELKKQLFLFVPAHRAKYYGLILQSTITVAFPAASQEIVAACNSLAVGLPTASVFHSMRAVEIGVRAVGIELGVTFSYPIELAEWGKIVGEIEPKLEVLKAGARSAEKDANLKFYSEAAAQFRHFNNGWRIRVSHARENYTEDQARSVIDHVISFFEILAKRLKEPPS
jgi:hypothetical protein